MRAVNSKCEVQRALGAAHKEALITCPGTLQICLNATPGLFYYAKAKALVGETQDPERWNGDIWMAGFLGPSGLALPLGASSVLGNTIATSPSQGNECFYWDPISRGKAHVASEADGGEGLSSSVIRKHPV